MVVVSFVLILRIMILIFGVVVIVPHQKVIQQSIQLAHFVVSMTLQKEIIIRYFGYLRIDRTKVAANQIVKITQLVHLFRQKD